MIILASGSPRRQELLGQVVSSFKSVKPLNDEIHYEGLDAYAQCQQLAYHKGLEVLKKYPYDTIISSDTMVVLEGEILGKPANYKEAVLFLKKLSNKSHYVFTSICVMSSQKTLLEVHESEVKVKALSDEMIDEYIEKHQPLDKAGAYGIQDAYFKEHCLEGYRGDLNTVIGLPIGALKVLIERFEHD